MTPTGPHEVTRLLALAREGEAEALDQLLPLLYEELRALAHRQRLRQGAAETLNTTALVHEAYERLARADGGWHDRTHFFRVAALAMRQILVDYARRKRTEKRGSGRVYSLESADPLEVAVEGRAEEVLAVDEALARLAQLDPRQSEVVTLRYFVGLSVPEAAEVLDVSPATVKRDWRAARAWLQREMGRST